MFDKVITERTKSTLALLGKEEILKKCYLAGGTAMALQFGHRLSFDLDFFLLFALLTASFFILEQSILYFVYYVSDNYPNIS